MAVDHELPGIVLGGLAFLQLGRGFGEEDQEQILNTAVLFHGLAKCRVLELVQKSGKGALDKGVVVFRHALSADEDAGDALVQLTSEAMR